MSEKLKIFRNFDAPKCCGDGMELKAFDPNTPSYEFQCSKCKKVLCCGIEWED